MVKKVVALNAKFMVKVKPKAPFNFDANVNKPSHFPAYVEDYMKGVYWQTMRFSGKVLGLKMENIGNALHLRRLVLEKRNQKNRMSRKTNPTLS